MNGDNQPVGHRNEGMSEPKKITIAFWASGVLLIVGILLANMPAAAAIITAGCLGLSFSVGWLVLYVRELP